MVRQQCFNDIEGRLNWLVARLKSRGAINLLDLHLHNETFYQHFLKILYGWDLDNLNLAKRNTPGLDLVDRSRKIVVQVSATASKSKINGSLRKAQPEFAGYTFKFICIGDPNAGLSKETFRSDTQLIFSPTTDIIDCQSLLKLISSMEVPKMESVLDFLKQELKFGPDPAKLESHLAAIITVLSAEDWSVPTGTAETKSFEIERKITYNQLGRSRALVEEYKIHQHRLGKIYAEYDRQGRNKSLSILNGIRAEFLLLDKAAGPDGLFFGTIANVRKRILESPNFQPLADEELNLCVEILVVDAFIRCKIFDRPPP